MSSRLRIGSWTWGPRAAITAAVSSRWVHRNRWRPAKLPTRVIICAPRWPRRAVSSANGHECPGPDRSIRASARDTDWNIGRCGLLAGGADLALECGGDPVDGG